MMLRAALSLLFVFGGELALNVSAITLFAPNEGKPAPVVEEAGVEEPEDKFLEVDLDVDAAEENSVEVGSGPGTRTGVWRE